MNATLASVFSWNAVVGAARYQWEVALASDPNNPLRSDETTALEVAATVAMASFAAGAYKFRVRAELGSVDGPWSAVVDFDFAPLSAPGGVTITG